VSKRITFDQLIVFESEDFIAINKPPFVPSLHERFDEGKSQSIVEIVKAVNEDYSLCHRLDRETSGVMLVAKHAEAYRFMSLLFENRQVKKTYHAIVSAPVNIQDLTVELSLYTDSKRRVQISRSKGKSSVTIINTLKKYKHFTLLACQPVTGRLHQIRVHCMAQNLPLVGDTLYGGKPAYLSLIKRKVHQGKDSEEKPMIGRFALHAHSIEFTNMQGEPVCITAPYANDFEVFVKLLDKYDTESA
jgi:23S rRNA pseudouridine955/2504/2580 synthase